MKQLGIYGLLFFSLMQAMDIPMDQQEVQKIEKNQAQLPYFILPRDICLKVARMKTDQEQVALASRKEVSHSRHYWSEQLRMSATWNSTQMIPDSHFWEHQLWFSDRGELYFRFDNDTSHDCNEFHFEDCPRENKIAFDGPNNESESGRENGVVLVGHSYQHADGNRTQFYLFKQHGKAVREYTGVQEKRATDRGEGFVLKYQNFPYVSEPFYGHTFDFCALAPHTRGIIATTDDKGAHHLHVFNYKYIANETDKTKADQEFKVERLATLANAPLFKRLAWIYGRTLLGITGANELYVVVIKEDEKNQPRIICYKQKISLPIINFCLVRPDNHHKVVLCDAMKKLYSCNLKYLNERGAFSLKPIKENDEVIKFDRAVDRLWAYEDRLTVMDISSSTCTFFNTAQAAWTEQMINRRLQELKEKHDKAMESNASAN